MNSCRKPSSTVDAASHQGRHTAVGIDAERAGDFDDCLAGIQPSLLNYILSLTGDREVSLDLRQAVNLVLWNKRGCFEAGSNFKSWAFRVAYFEVRNHFRKARKFRHQALDECPAPELVAEPAGDDDSRRLEALLHFLCGLRAKDVALIRHRYWDQGTLEAFASREGCRVGTLKARLFQLRSRLRRQIEIHLHRTARQ